MTVALAPPAGEVAHDSTALVLVDYSNVVDNEPDNPEAAVRLLLTSVTSNVLNLLPECTFIDIRAYGGWMRDGTHTASASQAAIALRAAAPFPFFPNGRRTALHGQATLATSLLADPQLDLDNTYRLRTRPPRVRINGTPVPQGCSQLPDFCPAVLVRRFTKKPQSSCPDQTCVLHACDVFQVFEQKMVDTHLACDLLMAADSPDYQLVIVVSCDTDFFPALLQAATFATNNMALLPPTDSWSTVHSDILAARGITVLESVA